MIKFTLALMTCISLSACGQTKSEMDDIENVKTENHVCIPGTRLYMIPPAGFKITTSLLRREKNLSDMQIYDLVRGNYYKDGAIFSKEAFEQKGAKVFDYKEFKVNGFPAKYICMQGGPSAITIGLVFGDSTFSTMIMSTYPANDDKTGEQIQKAISTIFYDNTLKVDPFAATPFTLDESKSIFKFCNSASGMLTYTIGGAVKQDFYDEEPYMQVLTLQKGTRNAESISNMMVEGIEQLGLTDKELKNNAATDVNGMDAFEVEVHGNILGDTSVVYQLTLTEQDQAIVIQGTIKSDFDNNLREIKNLAKTIRLK